MFSKLILAGLLGTGLIGTSAVTGASPKSIEFAAGPIRLESGNGALIKANMAQHAPLGLTIKLKNNRQLQIRL